MKKAKEMIFICDRYTAQQALEMNLINKVVPREKLREETESWCRKILANSPQTIRYCKISMQFESDQLHASWAHGSELLSVVWGSAESLEGMRAFMEKRPPDFARFRERNQQAVSQWE